MARTIVNCKAKIAPLRSPHKMAWCDQVQAAPDVNKRTVFKNGNPQGSIASTPLGGHTEPSSGTGFILEWKNAQKNAKKNITSEAINKIIPKRILNCTIEVCWPSKVASRIISRHHTNITKTIPNIPKTSVKPPPL